jgi:hypothetical protein
MCRFYLCKMSRFQYSQSNRYTCRTRSHLNKTRSNHSCCCCCSDIHSCLQNLYETKKRYRVRFNTISAFSCIMKTPQIKSNAEVSIIILANLKSLSHHYIRNRLFVNEMLRFLVFATILTLGNEN